MTVWHLKVSVMLTFIVSLTVSEHLVFKHNVCLYIHVLTDNCICREYKVSTKSLNVPNWCNVKVRQLKGGLSCKIETSHIHKYFIVTTYLWNNSLVKYIDDWIRLYIYKPINPLPKSSTLTFNDGVVTQDVKYLREIWKLENQWCVTFSFKLKCLYL